MTFREQGGPSTEVYAEFRAAVKTYIQARDGNRVGLAREFEVASTTVDRWWLGTASPHPTLQRQIVEWIRKQSP